MPPQTLLRRCLPLSTPTLVPLHRVQTLPLLALPRAQHRTMSSSGPHSRLLATLHHFHESKWGWLIYRTSYRSPATWTRFTQILASWSGDELSAPGVPVELKTMCGWTVVSDPTLEGASRQELRNRFREWRATAVKEENPNRREGLRPLPQRYLHFVVVDEEAMESVVRAGGDWMGGGWVELARADETWDFAEREDGEEDEGWMRIRASMVNAEFYEAVGVGNEGWYSFWRAPPEVVDW